MPETPTELGYPPHATLVGSDDVNSVPAAFRRTVARFGKAVAFRTLDDTVRWTWDEVSRHVDAVAGGLASLGVAHGEAVAMICTNRPEQLVVDLAALHLGAAGSSLYNTLPAAELAHILDDLEARVLVTERAFLDVVSRALGEGCERIEYVVVVDEEDPSGLDGVTMLGLAELGRLRAPEGFDLHHRWRAVGREDIAQIIYTSGTTGPPKGVELSHRSALQSADVYRIVAPLLPGRRLLSAFPLAHAAERTVTYYVPVLQGHCVTFCPDIRRLADYYLAVRPAYVFMTPSSLDRFRAAIERWVASRSDHDRARLREAIDVGCRIAEAEQLDREPAAEDVARWAEGGAVRREILGVVGLDEVEYAGVGSAPVSLELMSYFQGLDLPVREGWGMTETGATTALGRLDERPKVGYTGPATPNMEIRLAEDGEILVRGPGLMTRYRHRPEETARVLGEDGWLRTGDIGALNAAGHLRMVDRKKELIINSNGKNMSPVKIEAKVRAAGNVISTVVAVGDSRPHVAALLKLDAEAVAALVGARWDGATPCSAELVAHPAVQEAVQAQIDRANDELSAVERVRSWRVITDEWTPGGPDLTATMKLRRRNVLNRYADLIEELYR